VNSTISKSLENKYFFKKCADFKYYKISMTKIFLTHKEMIIFAVRARTVRNFEIF